MKVKLLAKTEMVADELQGLTPEGFIVSVARVSNPKNRENNKHNYKKLLSHLLEHGHWSPFEHYFFTFEIETSRAIGRQLLRHRSMYFQEWSQRYSEPIGFEPIELRKKAEINRQGSGEVFDPELIYSENGYCSDRGYDIPYTAQDAILEVLNCVNNLYTDLIRIGVAPECARMVLPECTSTTIIVTGNVRSWIHFLKDRLDDNAQKEIRLISIEIYNTLQPNIPNILPALN